MEIQPSPHFTPVPLAASCNIDRDKLPEHHAVPLNMVGRSGVHNFRGIPIDIGNDGHVNAILLADEPVTVPMNGQRARYLVMLHAVENDRLEALGQQAVMGNVFGESVSSYTIEYADGSTHEHVNRRRLSIQQYNICWGSSSAASVPANYDRVTRANHEDIALGKVPQQSARTETRHSTARDLQPTAHLYAMPNPHPEKEIAAVTLAPGEASSAVFGMSLTTLEEHPLRHQVRQKCLLTLPEGVAFNAIDEIDNIAVDLGHVISARRHLEYQHDDWSAESIDQQPTLSADKVVVEYAAHPQAQLQIHGIDGQSHVFSLAEPSQLISEIRPATRPVTIRVIDKQSRVPVAVRVHFHGEHGEYLPPKGHHRRVNTQFLQDVSGEFQNGHNAYAYIQGHCVLDAPLGTVYVEISRGYEISVIRESFEVTRESSEFCFELDRVLDWRSRGWVTADTHVHFLTPTTAVLEGEAEGVNVVNVLATQLGEAFSNVGDFDGTCNHSNTLAGNDGEFIARVGSENRMHVLGHISLLGYRGELIQPLCTGGASESAIGDAQEVTMAQWAQQCIDQNGMVVMPHAPHPQAERAADIVLDLVHAMEMMIFNPHEAAISPFGIIDWYRFLNLGYHLPVVGGSDKMCAQALLGGIRTYTQLDDRELSYENWMAATRQGNTFVTIGPLLEMNVDGAAPGSRLSLPDNGGTVTVSWHAESVRVPISKVEVVAGGEVVGEQTPADPMSATGSCDVRIEQSTWLAVRIRGSYQGNQEDLAAHSSVVQVMTGAQPIYSETDAVSVLRQIEGSIAYIDTLAARPDADRYRKMQLVLESAYNRLHQQMHAAGHYHEHTPMHRHGHEH